MRIACVSDLHGAVITPTLEADVLVIAGDITNQGRYLEIMRAIDWITVASNNYKHILWVPGNHDMGVEEKLLLPPNCVNLRKQKIELEGVSFYGESLSCCFDLPRLAQYWEYMTADKKEDLFAWEYVPYADIIISHSPPLGLLDKTDSKVHIGSPGLRKYIKKHHPKLVICGHVHESQGQRLVEKTLVVNTAQKLQLIEV